MNLIFIVTVVLIFVGILSNCQQSNPLEVSFLFPYQVLKHQIKSNFWRISILKMN